LWSFSCKDLWDPEGGVEEDEGVGCGVSAGEELGEGLKTGVGFGSVVVADLAVSAGWGVAEEEGGLEAAARGEDVMVRVSRLFIGERAAGVKL
jgi:hypothetical protein